jgi:hypothetical protein
MYLGVSPEHSSSVDLALNLKTGFISPQFHFVRDDLFATITSHWDDVTFDLNHWNTIIQSGQERYCDSSTHPPPLADEWLSSEQAVQEQRRQFHRRRHASARQRDLPTCAPRDHLPGGGVASTKQFTIYLTICLSIHRKLFPKLLYKFQVRYHLSLQHLCLLLILILIHPRRRIKIKMKKMKPLYMM